MSRERNRAATRGAALVWIAVVLVVLVGGGIALWGRRGDEPAKQVAAKWAAVKEKMRVSVVESGQLKAAKSTDIYCKVKGGATILKLVTEGSRVNEGDVVVQLDANNLETELTQQKIKFLNAQAAKIQADKTVEIQKNKNESDVQKATVDLSLAQTDLEKYKNGDFKLKFSQAKSDQKLAESEQKAAQQKADDTAELVKLDFAAETELQSDQLAAERARVKLEMSVLQQEVLVTYEKPRQEKLLESDVAQKTAELERVKLRCEADMAQKVADFESKKATFDLEESRLKDLEGQLNNTTIKAPAAGLVVYPANQGGMGGMGRSDRDRIEEGAQARENQLLISLPDTREMLVTASVHESSVDKVRVGQPAIVTVDALPDKSYVGKVTFIAPLPDSQNQWLNPDLKVYRCEVTVGGETAGLRPGMSAGVEIVIDELADAIAVPIHSVHRQNDAYYVYVDGGDGKPQVRRVKIGLHNDARVAITEGLAVGDQVFLSTPAGAPQPDFPVDAKKVADTSVDELRKKADAISSKSAATQPPAGASGAGGAPAMQGGFGGGFGDPSKFASMTPEERQKAMQDWLNSLPEDQRKAMEERMKAGGGRGFGRRRDGANGDGAAKPADGGGEAKPAPAAPAGDAKPAPAAPANDAKPAPAAPANDAKPAEGASKGGGSK